MRPTRTGILGVFADCLGCNWQSEARNAKGNAAQHHDRTGHTVHVEESTVTIYGDPNAPMPGQTSLEDATA